MVFMRFDEGFIVVALLLVSFGLQNLSIHAYADHHQERRLMGVNSAKGTQETDGSFDQKKVVSGMGSKEVMRMGGRKMGMMLKKEDGEMVSRSSRSTSADINAAKEGPQDFLNNQGQENTSERMTINPSQSSQKVASSKSFNTNKIFPEEDTGDEWKRLLEDADKKVMQMMRRDYSGMRRPRRKPPINNHEPRN
ncbi:uncharacterized protein LOC112516004 isoform X2 [Cynara cardunculus var. scolymus]|uniref:uncharacterized protein LOC112516004 isoform X2 n=1 Tax=Cynara cardunculus var. scolymus TaxID=59895 RepID=UPI000D629EC8|nr:uncharacterized protein LOC112516004 isoform X2 [Cynara cardunculus var. scolymus]